eukprot:gene11045-23089_t
MSTMFFIIFCSVLLCSASFNSRLVAPRRLTAVISTISSAIPVRGIVSPIFEGSILSAHIDRTTTITTAKKDVKSNITHWVKIKDMGVQLAKLTSFELIRKGLYAGVFIGFGGILAASVGFDMGGSPWIPGKGQKRFLCGAIGYPFTNMLMAITGETGWTGDVFVAIHAFKEKSISLQHLLKVMLFSYIGCYMGTFLMASIANAAALPALAPSMNIAKHKYSWTVLQTFLRAIVGGVMISYAIFATKICESLVDKLVAIWLVISTQVVCDFEHVLGSLFVLPCAAMSGYPFSMKRYLTFIATATVGNLIGVMLVACGLLRSTLSLSVSVEEPSPSPSSISPTAIAPIT